MFETVWQKKKNSTKKSLIERQNILYSIFRTKQCEADECNSIIYDLWAHDETWYSWTMILNISSPLLVLYSLSNAIHFSFILFTFLTSKNNFFSRLLGWDKFILWTRDIIFIETFHKWLSLLFSFQFITSRFNYWMWQKDIQREKEFSKRPEKILT